MRRAAGILLLIAVSTPARAEFVPADDWLICWRAAIAVEARQVVRGLDATAQRVEWRGRLWESLHARVRASSLQAAALQERDMRLALRWRAPWLELQCGAGLQRGELPGLPIQRGHSMSVAAAMSSSNWSWGLRWSERRRDVPESSRFQFALRHRVKGSVVALTRENQPFARAARWGFAVATWIHSTVRMALAVDGAGFELRWHVQRSRLGLMGGLPLWSELGTGPSIAVEWRLP